MGRYTYMCWTCGSTNLKIKTPNPYQARRSCGDCGEKKEIFKVAKKEIEFYRFQRKMINCAGDMFNNPPKNKIHYYYQRIAAKVFKSK